MPRKTTTKFTIGKAIENDRKRRADQGDKTTRITGVSEKLASRSVLEPNSLDDFLATAELAQASFDAVRGEAHVVETGPQLVATTAAEAAQAEARCSAARRQVQVPIPWRPEWQGMDADELAVKEGEAFLEWRRGLAKLEEEEFFVMTPYERNLEFWRQLWRCVEKSDLLVQILDARDPEFYRCQDLERYVDHFGTKRHLLLVNKADFLSADLRRKWAAWFAEHQVDAVFFSALRELHKQQRLPATETSEDAADKAPVEMATEDSCRLPPHGPLHSDDVDVADCAQLVRELQARLPEASRSESSTKGVVGFVGYPNVGKSSVINALFGAKKVSMSRTPGKTKHLQTLELPDLGLTLCDCPGLVFPSVAASKAHLVINGTSPLDELRDFVAPVRLVVEKVGLNKLVDKYGLSVALLKEGAERRGEGRSNEALSADTARAFLGGYATARQHMLRLGVPDETWAARKVLRDFCTGELLHCEHPSGSSTAIPSSEEAQGGVTSAETSARQEQAEPTEASQELLGESDFSDLDDFLKGEAQGKHDRRLTKRKQRQINKRLLKGDLAGGLDPSVAKGIRGKSTLG